jgi:beta-galactosidase
MQLRWRPETPGYFRRPRETTLAAIAAAVLVAGGPTALAAPDFVQNPRVVVSLDAGWRFKQAARLVGAERPEFDDSAWATVAVPHSWNRLGNAGAERSPLTNTVQGTGWYRLRFKTPRVVGTRRYFLQFDGVSSVADVWLNGQHLGQHAGAFSRFRFDASAAVDPQGVNVLVVRADNSRPQPGATTANVIPLSGDFFMFGGIYRSVALVITHPIHVDMYDFGGPGLYARALAISSASATVHVTGRLANEAETPERVGVETAIEDASGNVVASDSRYSSALAAKVIEIHADMAIPAPRLWRGTRDPYLYSVTMTLRSPSGAVFDRIRQPLGLRTVRLDPDQGFILNGERLVLHGASMHQDRPLKGWAISRSDQDEDFDLLVDLGANCVRLAHYQHDQYSYELADARGIVAWAEIPLVNRVSFDGSPAGRALTANAKQQLTELIRQNYNHPSIVVWSVANEVDLTATQTKGPSRPAALLETLDRLAKREDPGRATTIADCCEPTRSQKVESDSDGVPLREAVVGTTETAGYNRYFGWYYGHFSDFGAMLDAAHARHPLLPIAVSEYGGGAALTQHSDDPTGGPINPHGRPHPEEFQALYHEASWAELRSRRYLWAVFVWNLFDFSSNSRQEGDLTDMNDKGLVSYDRKVRKDAFYFYRANWSSRPTLYLTGRRYTRRPYSVVDVKAYSNAARAGLWLNDSNQGETPCVEGICVWPRVQLQPGSNKLRASAEIASESISDTVQWQLEGSPTVVRIKAGDISGYVSRDGRRYGSDTYFTGGRGQGIDAPDAPAGRRAQIVAADERLYDSFREGDFSYRIPVPPGRYRVTLSFDEPRANGPEERVFDVDVNGAAALKDVDVFAAAGGKLKGVERSFDVTIDAQDLLIAFRSKMSEAIVSALSITPLDRQ